MKWVGARQVGDSVTEQTFLSLGCQLEASGGVHSPRWAADEWKRLSVPPEATPRDDGFRNDDFVCHPVNCTEGVDALYSKCLLASTSFGGEVRVCLVKTDPEPLVELAGLLQRMAGRANDTVVMNFGVRAQP